MTETSSAPFIPAPHLSTSRLLLRPLHLDDAPQIQQLFPHWEIVRYLFAGGVPWPYPPDGAETYLRHIALPAIARGEQWHWTLRLKSAPAQLIGAISLHQGEWDNRGYWLGLPWQRQGLMTEAVLPVTDFWFNQLGNSRLRASKAIENEPSRRISRKTAMRVIQTAPRHFCKGELPTEIWEVSAEAWAIFRRT